MTAVFNVALLIWGIIAFWGTPWAWCAVVLIAVDALIAAYKIGQQHGDEKEEE